MDTPKVSQMWHALQQAHKLPRTEVLSGAEDELQELMRQIDIMVNNRKTDWEKEKQMLSARLDIREKEHHIQTKTLDQKHSEIGHLRAQLDSVEDSQRNAASEYEKQLGSLRDEFVSVSGSLEIPCYLSAFPSDDDSEIAGMKKEFEKLHRRYTKKTKHAESEQHRSSSTAQENATEVKRLTTKLEEFRKRAKEWEHKRRGYDQQIEDLQKQMHMLQDRQHNAEGSGSLHASLEEARLANKILADDKRELQTSLSHMHTTVKKSEEELEHIRAQNLLSQQSWSDQQKLVTNLEESVKRKDALIRDLQKNPSKDMEAVKKLEVDLLRIREELRRSQESKSKHQEETQQLITQLEDLYKEKELLSTKFQQKSAELIDVRQNTLQKYSMEISKLKADHSTLGETHKGQIDGMKREMSAVAAELHEKIIIISTLNNKLLTNEKQAYEYSDLSDKNQAELQVATAQLNALRVENRHLRSAALTQDGSDVDLNDSEHHLKELQTAYSTSIASLEAQNEGLRTDIEQLKERLDLVEGENTDKIQHTMAESQRAIQNLQHREHKKIQEVEEKSRKEMRDLEDKLNTTVEQYENQIDSLQLEMSTLRDNIDIQNQSMKRLGLEHDVMTKFVNGVDHMIQSPSRQENTHVTNGNLSNQNSQGNTGTDCSLEIDEEMEDDYLTDTAETATAKFLRDQEERTRQLEQQLDNHILYLKSATDETVRKFTVKSH